MIEEIDRSSWFDRYMYTWVELYAENGEFRAGNVRNWRTFIERANEHQEPTGHNSCTSAALKTLTRLYIASEAKQNDSLYSQCERVERSWMKTPTTARRCKL